MNVRDFNECHHKKEWQRFSVLFYVQPVKCWYRQSQTTTAAVKSRTETLTHKMLWAPCFIICTAWRNLVNVTLNTCPVFRLWVYFDNLRNYIIYWIIQNNLNNSWINLVIPKINFGIHKQTLSKSFLFSLGTISHKT